jgi:hypothetical protein
LWAVRQRGQIHDRSVTFHRPQIRFLRSSRVACCEITRIHRDFRALDYSEALTGLGIQSTLQSYGPTLTAATSRRKDSGV